MGKGSLALPADQILMKGYDLLEQRELKRTAGHTCDMYKWEITLASKDCLHLKIIHADIWAEGEP